MRVWAPGRSTVHLVLADAAVVMTPEADGWWSANVDLVHGQDYAFSLDGGPPLPDPRSPWQPLGVHGPSRGFDPGRFSWTDQDWAGRDARGAVHYELHVGTFTADGTLDSAAARVLVPAAAPPPSLGTDLSDREREVLLLVMKGLTNRQIAARLFLSPGTIRIYVSHILSKLGAANRTEASALAFRNHIVPQDGDLPRPPARAEKEAGAAGAGEE